MATGFWPSTVLNIYLWWCHLPHPYFWQANAKNRCCEFKCKESDSVECFYYSINDDHFILLCDAAITPSLQDYNKDGGVTLGVLYSVTWAVNEADFQCGPMFFLIES